MAKFKISFKESQILVKSKLERNEEIDERELDIISQKFISGLMRPKVTGNRKIEYSGPGNRTLYAFLTEGITRNDFFIILAQTVETLKKIQYYSFKMNNLVLDVRRSFYNTVTNQVNFIYQPLVQGNTSANVFTFIYDMASLMVLKVGEDERFLNHLLDYIRSLKTVTPEMLEQYILKVYPSVYKKVRRQQAGQSQALKNTGWNYYEKKYSSNVTDGKGEAADEEPEDIDISQIQASSHLQRSDDFDDEKDTDILEEYEDDDDEEGTTVLIDEGTTLLQNNTPSYPYIIRLNTYDKVNVDKPVFRIGKEKSYVDYFVASNSAVSRIHADIITRDGCYYIKDENSTNHTFVNGTMIPVNQNVQIFDGDSFMLANEPFEFHVK